MPDEIFKIYSIIREDTEDYNHGGGVCTYISDTIPFRPRPDLSHSTIECVWVTIRPSWLPRKVSRIAVAAINIPPSTTNIEINEFYDYLCFCTDKLTTSVSAETGFIITGDFNPNNNNFRSRHVELQCDFKQVVQIPTRNKQI